MVLSKYWLKGNTYEHMQRLGENVPRLIHPVLLAIMHRMSKLMYHDPWFSDVLWHHLEKLQPGIRISLEVVSLD